MSDVSDDAGEMGDVSESAIACSLDAAGLAGRTEEMRGLLAAVLIGRERTAEGLLLRFPATPETERRLRDLMAREKACCPFFEFELRRRGQELLLEVTAPGAARPLVDALFAAEASDDTTARPVGHAIRPLEGRRILVTRPAGQAAELVSALRAQGAEPVLAPAIEIRPLDDTRGLDRALERVLSYDWVIFTSANGVRHAWERLAALGMEDVLEHGEDGRRAGRPRVAAIGPGTAAALERRGVRPDYVPPEYVAEALADGLPDAEGATVLMLRADVARATLRERLEARGARAEDVTTYRTIAHAAASSSIAEVESAPKSERDPGHESAIPATFGRIDAVTFTSSSTVRGFLRSAGRVPEGAAVICIGPVTARTAHELGLRVDAVAESYTVQGLVEALVRHFEAYETGEPTRGERPERGREKGKP